ncbi:MAG: VCBS repeat-containing protein [Methanomassiliicoccales archaeon]|nr:MAG: VCBS repeat-containing protein [Methanomassiliicoccales archaeon]
MRGSYNRIVRKMLLAWILSLFMLLPAQIAGDFEFRADYSTGDGPHSACLGDLDDDGDLDIVTADYYEDKVSILLNDGEGVFVRTYMYQTGEGPRSVFLADVDSDDDIDITTANYYDDTVSVLKNNGDGTFASKIDYDVGEGPFSLFLVDVGEDSSGDVDLITADEQSFRVSVLENDGSGAFGNSKTYQVGTKPKGLFLADLDDDGYNDITTANWADDTVSVLMNKKDGTFEKDVEYDTGNAPRSIFLADIDGDMLPDIITTNQYVDSISIILNNGDGTFGSKTDYPVGTRPISLFSGDIDGDSDNDVLTTNLGADTISILENDENGNLGNRVDHDTDHGPYCVLLGEVNGDEKIDIITANNYDDTVSVHYSNFPPSIWIWEPDGIDDVANNEYTITWEDFDPYEDAAITIYWDDDNQGFDGTEIASGLSEDDNGIGGMYTWDISAVPEGEYWIYAKIDDGVFEPAYDYSAGKMTVNHSIVSNSPPTFQLTEPDGNNDFADLEFTIMWMDSDPDDDALISLFYDTDDQGFNGVLIVEGLGEDADGGSGFYNWATSGISEGEYYIYGICDDGNNEAVRRYSSYFVTVNHTTSQNNIPSIQIVEPDGVDDQVNTEYMISWIDSDADDDASISLYYDSDSSGHDGTVIVSGLSEDEHGSSGVYLWDTSSVSEGEYWIYAKIWDDSSVPKYNYCSGPLTISHSSTSNTPPSFYITEPDGQSDFANRKFTIMWVDSDPDDDASISLYYDMDNMGFDGVEIVTGISENSDGSSGYFSWNTTNVQLGEYYIYGICDDGNNEAIKRYSNFPVVIDHNPSKNNPPLIQLVEPDGEEDYANTEYMIIWIDSDNDDDASISLYYDPDAAGFNGKSIANDLSEDALGNSGVYIWDTTNIPEGEYFVYAIIEDGIDISRDYSPGKITIDHSGAFNCAPTIVLITPEKGVKMADSSYMIRWIDSDSDDDASISLFYDTDQNGYDGTLIVSELSENDEDDSYVWDTTGIIEGEYYLYGIITDGHHKEVYDYSDGKLRIYHGSNEDENQNGDDDPGRSTPSNSLLLGLLAVIIIIALILFLLMKRKTRESEEEPSEEEEDFEETEKEHPTSQEDIEGDEIDEELLPSDEDLKGEDFDEDLLPPPEDFEGGELDEEPPPPEDVEDV